MATCDHNGSVHGHRVVQLYVIVRTVERIKEDMV
jgi:hypothetical protein